MGTRNETGVTVLVTGANGFIGSHACKAFHSMGHQVRAVIRSCVEESIYEVIFADLTESLSVNDIIGVDVILHFAARAEAVVEFPEENYKYFDINVTGTRNLLEVAKEAGVRRFIFFSSVKAMGESSEFLLDENDKCLPVTAYGRSKLEAERLVLNGGYVPEPVVLRLPMVYGVTKKGSLPKLIRAISKKRFPPMPELGNKRSMVHVDDVVQAALLVMNRDEAIGQIFIVTDGLAYSTRQIYDLIKERLGMSESLLSIPLVFFVMLALIGDLIGKVLGKRFIFDSDTWSKLKSSAEYSNKKIVNKLGFSPKNNLSNALPDIVKHVCGN